MLETPLAPARIKLRAGSAHVPTPHPVPPVTPPMPEHPDETDSEPVSPEPTVPVQEPPDEGDVPTRLPGHPGKPVHVHVRHNHHHEHPGA